MQMLINKYRETKVRITHVPFHRELDDLLYNSWTPQPDQSYKMEPKSRILL